MTTKFKQQQVKSVKEMLTWMTKNCLNLKLYKMYHNFSKKFNNYSSK